MPKLIPFKKVSEEKFIIEESEIKFHRYDARIQVPFRLGSQIKGKKVKVTIEVLDE